MKKDLTNGYSISDGAKCFAEDGSQIYLINQSLSKFFQKFTGTSKVFS